MEREIQRYLKIFPESSKVLGWSKSLLELSIKMARENLNKLFGQPDRNSAFSGKPSGLKEQFKANQLFSSLTFLSLCPFLTLWLLRKQKGIEWVFHRVTTLLTIKFYFPNRILTGFPGELSVPRSLRSTARRNSSSQILWTDGITLTRTAAKAD